jgi:predicted acyl esterase
VSAAVPTIVVATVCHRGDLKDGKVVMGIPQAKGLLELLLREGYAVAIVDMRGHGASFGTSMPEGWRPKPIHKICGMPLNGSPRNAGVMAT